eukprot:1461483-Amphidinium_carterae.1
MQQNFLERARTQNCVCTVFVYLGSVCRNKPFDSMRAHKTLLHRYNMVSYRCQLTLATVRKFFPRLKLFPQSIMLGTCFSRGGARQLHLAISHTLLFYRECKSQFKDIKT